jgi:hypothetical protein
LPVPDSPVSSTPESVGAAACTMASTRFQAALSPIAVSLPPAPATALRR